MPNYHRYYLPGHPVFVTIVTHRRSPWLDLGHNKGLVTSSMRRVKTKHPFRHIAHVILPDHVHWMFEPLASTNFSMLVASLKRDVTWRARKLPGRRTGLAPGQPLWQRRFYDHVVRDDEDFERHLDYIHFNPVKHGLVTRASEYPYSTFAEWVKRGAYASDWGSTEPSGIAGMDPE